MPIPKLKHPILFLIEPVDKESSIHDDHAREEIQVIRRRPTVEIVGQIEYRDSVVHGLSNQKYDEKGIISDEQGYVIFRFVDLKIVGYNPQLGDRIKVIGYKSENPQIATAYFDRLKQTAHYPRYGSTMIKCYFKDRKPSHNG